MLKGNSTFAFAVRGVLAAIPVLAFLNVRLAGLLVFGPMVALFVFAPSIVAGSVVSGLATTHFIEDSRRWWRVSVGIAVATVVVSVPFSFVLQYYLNQAISLTDVVRFGLVAGALPIVSACVAKIMLGVFGRRWMAVYFALLALWVSLTPALLLGVRGFQFDS